jgi:hypothetical protein
MYEAQRKRTLRYALRMSSLVAVAWTSKTSVIKESINIYFGLFAYWFGVSVGCVP